MQTTYTIGARTFVLDREKAEAALAAKRVVGGRETLTFNLLPLRYGWAYELYRTMKANHWEPEDVPMQRDLEQWRDRAALSEIDRWIVRMGIGYFSAAEGIVGDNVIHVVRELVTASELKLVLGRHAHEENIHADSLLYMISSLGIDPHECEAMFDDIPTIVAKNRFVTEISRDLRRDLDMDDPASKQLLAKNIFVFGQCMEGTQRARSTAPRPHAGTSSVEGRRAPSAPSAGAGASSADPSGGPNCRTRTRSARAPSSWTGRRRKRRSRPSASSAAARR